MCSLSIFLVVIVEAQTAGECARTGRVVLAGNARLDVGETAAVTDAAVSCLHMRVFCAYRKGVSADGQWWHALSNHVVDLLVFPVMGPQTGSGPGGGRERRGTVGVGGG